MNNVFIVPFHVKRGRAAIMPAGIAGAYVSCYVAADNYEIAVKKCIGALQNDGMQIEKILQPIKSMIIADWSLHVSEQWPDQSVEMPSQEEFEIAVKADKVVYGPFGSY